MTDIARLEAIFPGGDVVLIVGPSETAVRLLVSSHVLRAASQVFNTMFGPKFSEGQLLGNEVEPKKVELAEDNPEAMEIICNILHFKHDQVPKELSGSMMLQATRIIDKYFLREAMGYYPREWFKLLGNEDTKELILMLKAALLLKQSAPIMAISKELVLARDDSYFEVVNLDDTDDMNLAANLTNKRNQLRTMISQAIFRALLADSNACACVLKYLSHLGQDIYLHNLDPIEIANYSVKSSLNSIAELRYPTKTDYSKYCSLSHMASSQPEYLMEVLGSRIEYVNTWSGFDESELRRKD